MTLEEIAKLESRLNAAREHANQVRLLDQIINTVVDAKADADLQIVIEVTMSRTDVDSPPQRFTIITPGVDFRPAHAVRNADRPRVLLALHELLSFELQERTYKLAEI